MVSPFPDLEVSCRAFGHPDTFVMKSQQFLKDRGKVVSNVSVDHWFPVSHLYCITDFLHQKLCSLFGNVNRDAVAPPPPVTLFSPIAVTGTLVLCSICQTPRVLLVSPTQFGWQSTHPTWYITPRVLFSCVFSLEFTTEALIVLSVLWQVSTPTSQKMVVRAITECSVFPIRQLSCNGRTDLIDCVECCWCPRWLQQPITHLSLFSCISLLSPRLDKSTHSSQHLVNYRRSYMSLSASQTHPIQGQQ